MTIEAEIIDSIRHIYKYAASSFFQNYPTRDLSFGRLQTLKLIAEGKQTISEISKVLAVTMPTATVIVNKLENAKLVKRQPSKTDRRVTELTITKKGEEILKKSEDAKEEHMKLFLAKLSQKDKESLAKMLKKLLQSI